MYNITLSNIIISDLQSDLVAENDIIFKSLYLFLVEYSISLYWQKGSGITIFITIISLRLILIHDIITSNF